MLSAGCAQIRLPRIDPSGNSVFLPGNASTQFLLPGASPSSSINSGGVANPVNPIFGPSNQIGTAPTLASGSAVVGDPFGRSSTNSLTQQNPAPTAIVPRIAAPQPQGVQPAFQQPPLPPPCDAEPVSKGKLTPNPTRALRPGQAGQLVMTPSKIIAPVGSEVVVLAGVCGDNGHFVKNQPLEWMLDNNSVGQFIEVGGMHHAAFNRLVPPTAKKSNGQYAWGRTGLKPLVLSRGTETPADDIEVREGQTYITVSSASPGVSYVTGVAPKAEGWPIRRGETRIYWVDANWSVPLPVSATAGTVSPLTTVVSDTNGNGVKDWIVRYSIVGGAPAEFAPSGSNSAEAKSDNNGQATVQIRQPIGQFEPGTTQVRVDIVRPPIVGQPELVVESGITSVTWSAPALTIRAIGPRSTEQDMPFNYRLEITNPGDQIARDVIVRTKDLASNIEFISATPKPSGEFGRQYEWRIGDVAPNADPKVIEVSLRSQKIGNVGLCFEVVSDVEGLQTEACAETEIVSPCISLSIEGPANARVGDDVTFSIRVENQCNQPLENVAMVIAYDTGLVRAGSSNPTTVRLQPDGVLNVGESKVFPFQARLQGTGPQCITVEITADGIRPERDRVCVNGNDATVSPTPTNPVGPTGSNNGLQIQTIKTVPPPSLGADISTIQVRLTNQSSVPIEGLTISTRPTTALAPEFVPDSSAVQEIGQWRQADGNEIFVPVTRLAPGQSILLDYGYRAVQDDPNASIQISATSNSGINVVDSIRVPAITIGGTGQPVVPNNPGSGAPNFGDEPSIGIPSDNLGGAGANNNNNNNNATAGEVVTVQVVPLNETIQRGQKTKIAFRVKNNSNVNLTNVDIDFILPNTLTKDDFLNDRGLPLYPDMKMPRIRTLPPGEGINGEMVLLGGNITGPAIFEIQVRADQLQGALTDRAVITIQ